MKLPISKLNYPSSSLSEDSFFVVDKYVDNTWKSYKARLSSIKNFMTPKSEDKYTVILDPNGGQIDGSTEVQTLELPLGAASANLPTPTARQAAANHAGVQFDGWWTGEWDGIQIQANTQVPNKPGTIKLYAHWKGVIHYGTVGTVSIDSNGVATLSRQTDNGVVRGALLTTEHDLFDFSKDFRVVIKCQRGSNDGYWHTGRQDVFAGYDNHNMDFGIFGWGAAQWEISKYTDGKVTTGNHLEITTANGQNFWLGVDVVFDAQNQRHVNCYCITHEDADLDNADLHNWQLDYTGSGQNYGSDRFYLGLDADSTLASYSDLIYEPFYGKIFLNQCYLLQKSTNAGNPKGKYILAPQTT